MWFLHETIWETGVNPAKSPCCRCFRYLDPEWRRTVTNLSHLVNGGLFLGLLWLRSICLLVRPLVCSFFSICYGYTSIPFFVSLYVWDSGHRQICMVEIKHNYRIDMYKYVYLNINGDSRGLKCSKFFLERLIPILAPGKIHLKPKLFFAPFSHSLSLSPSLSFFLLNTPWHCLALTSRIWCIYKSLFPPKRLFLMAAL